VRAALYWALGESDPTAIDIALRLSGGLWRFWWVRGYVNEGTRLLREALSRAALAAPASRAKALHGAGKLARERGVLEEAEDWCRQALETVRAIGDQQTEALVLNSLGNIVGDRSDYAGAAELYSQSLELRRALGDRPGAALALHNLAAVARSAGDLARASSLCAESLELARAAGDRWGIAIGLGLEARLALSRDDPSRAQPLCAESLALRQQLGDRQGIIRCLEIMVEIALRTGKLDRAARLLGAVEALRTETGIGLPLDERADYDRKVASVRERLGEPRTSLAWAEGQGMDAHRAIAYATSTAPEPVAMPRPARNADPLSQRELEVARLVARGLTNRQIADELIISKWTADNHVGNILRKLELIGRAQVAAWLAERGLLAAELDAAAAGANG
jgi:non-specific serine/threonine protein kinase